MNARIYVLLLRVIHFFYVLTLNFNLWSNFSLRHHKLPQIDINEPPMLILGINVIYI